MAAPDQVNQLLDYLSKYRIEYRIKINNVQEYLTIVKFVILIYFKGTFNSADLSTVKRKPRNWDRIHLVTMWFGTTIIATKT